MKTEAAFCFLQTFLGPAAFYESLRGVKSLPDFWKPQRKVRAVSSAGPLALRGVPDFWKP